MKQFFFSVLLSLTCATLAAQSAPCDYTKLIREGRDSLQAKRYQGALKKFNAARTCDRDKSPEVDKAVDAVFRAIEGEKEEALRQKKRAEEAQRQAEAQRRRAEDALKQADLARQRSDSLYEVADAERRRAEAVLDKIYFYKDRFGLASENALVRNGKNYGFIDKQLNTKIGFHYEEALPFDHTGYAKVRRDDYYLIDTTGAEFLLATEVSQINSDIIALDLRHKKLSQIPYTIFSQTQLKVLLLAGNQLNILPAEIGQLKNLQSLDLYFNQLSALPPEIGQLKNLQSLDLYFNQLSTLPPQGRRMNVQVRHKSFSILKIAIFKKCETKNGTVSLFSPVHCLTRSEDWAFS